MTDNVGENPIRYNVGGQVFEVSHDAVNQHPTTILAKMAAEYAQNSSTDVIFIDGDAERFGYVLDYLRTGRAVLSFFVPKSAFLQDLYFYGFQNIDPKNIDAISAADAVAQVAQLEEEYNKNMKKRDDEIAALQFNQACFWVAHECFNLYIKNGISKPFRVHGSDSRISLCFSKFNRGLLNEMLTVYGLEYQSYQSEGGYIMVTFGKLPTK